MSVEQEQFVNWMFRVAAGLFILTAGAHYDLGKGPDALISGLFGLLFFILTIPIDKIIWGCAGGLIIGLVVMLPG